MRRWWFVATIVFVLSCTKTVYVPVERKTEVLVERRDTIVYTKIEKEVVEVVTPDTVAVAQTRYAEARAEVSRGRLTLGLRNKDDSIKVATRVIYKTVRDSIPYPIEVIKEKKVRYVSWFDRIIRWVGGISFLIIVLAVAYKIFKWRIGLR
jgi:hypothetical protein